MLNIVAAENIVQLYDRIKKLVYNLMELEINNEKPMDLINYTTTIKKSIITYHKNISTIEGLEANETEIFHKTIQILEKTKGNSGLKNILYHINFYLSETEFVLKKINNQICLFKQNCINKINNLSLGKKKIVVLGINDFTLKIKAILNQKNNEVIAFFSSDGKFKWKEINGIPVLGTEVINEIEYDYMILGEKSNLIFNDNKTLDLIDYINNFYDFEVSRAIYPFFKKNIEVNGLVTGSSYAETAIDVKKIKNFNFINVAVSSQDLYYDFELVKFTLSDLHFAQNIKTVIINLGYASFQYDLSLSINKHRTFFYYPFIKKIHHNHKEELIEKYNRYLKIANRILIDNFHITLFELLEGNSRKNWVRMMNRELGKREIEQAEKMVEKDCNKNYPLTVRENISILEEYIEFLKSKGVTPIITICPTNKHYNSKFSNRIKLEFKQIIKEIQKKYNLQILDYFESEEFEDRDFYDVSHLNRRGSEKFTTMISSELNNLYSKFLSELPNSV